jgi:group I intron endonuclease
METNKETWILYQTTNVCNSRIYVGVHKLANTSRSKNYLGSGDALQLAVKKYGKDKFTRTTLAEFSCAEDAYEAEANMVTEEFISRPDTYNICLGGLGCKGVAITEEHRAKISAANKGKPKSEEHKAKIAAGRSRPESTEKFRAANGGVNHHLYGKHHTEATKAKIAAAHSTKEAKARLSASRSGEKHPMCVAIIVDGRYYAARKFAAEAENVFPKTVSARIASNDPKWSGWRNATEEEKRKYMANKVQ